MLSDGAQLPAAQESQAPASQSTEAAQALILTTNQVALSQQPAVDNVVAVAEPVLEFVQPVAVTAQVLQTAQPVNAISGPVVEAVQPVAMNLATVPEPALLSVQPEAEKVVAVDEPVLETVQTGVENLVTVTEPALQTLAVAQPVLQTVNPWIEEVAGVTEPELRSLASEPAGQLVEDLLQAVEPVLPVINPLPENVTSGAVSIVLMTADQESELPLPDLSTPVVVGQASQDRREPSTISSEASAIATESPSSESPSSVPLAAFEPAFADKSSRLAQLASSIESLLREPAVERVALINETTKEAAKVLAADSSGNSFVQGQNVLDLSVGIEDGALQVPTIAQTSAPDLSGLTHLTPSGIVRALSDKTDTFSFPMPASESRSSLLDFVTTIFTDVPGAHTFNSGGGLTAMLTALLILGIALTLLTATRAGLLAPQSLSYKPIYPPARSF